MYLNLLINLIKKKKNVITYKKNLGCSSRLLFLGTFVLMFLINECLQVKRLLDWMSPSADDCLFKFTWRRPPFTKCYYLQSVRWVSMWWLLYRMCGSCSYYKLVAFVILQFNFYEMNRNVFYFINNLNKNVENCFKYFKRWRITSK